jgi:hypothetical protein
MTGVRLDNYAAPKFLNPTFVIHKQPGARCNANTKNILGFLIFRDGNELEARPVISKSIKIGIVVSDQKRVCFMTEIRCKSEQSNVRMMFCRA